MGEGFCDIGFNCGCEVWVGGVGVYVLWIGIFGELGYEFYGLVNDVSVVWVVVVVVGEMFGIC